jgi:hypothetical protein
MHSRLLKLWAVMSVLVGGCGILGEKAEALKKLAFSSSRQGCLDGFSKQLAQFKEGTLNEADWNKSLDCVDSQIETFKKFVEPSTSSGYSVEDIRIFIERFLVTSQTVSSDIVRAGFELKAALLGGSTTYISPLELKALLTNLAEIRQISVDLLREIQILKRRSVPSDQELVRFSGVARQAGERLAELLPTEARAVFSLQSVHALIAEMKRFGIEIDPALGGAIMAAKVLFLGGTEDAIEPDAWRELARLAGRLVGPAWIATQVKADSEGRQFYERRAVFARFLGDLSGAISGAMARHGGRWQTAQIDRIIDESPGSWISIDRSVLKQALRPFISKLLGGTHPESLDPAQVSVLTQLAENWSRGALHINAIFRQAGAEQLAWQNLIDHSVAYVSRLTESQSRQDAERLVSLVRDYQPVIAAGGKQIQFNSFLEYSKTQLEQVHLYNLVVRHFLSIYGTSSAGRVQILRPEFDSFFTDFLALAGELKVLDPTTIDIAGKRFRDIDLFTLASDGNAALSEREITYFLVYVSSIAQMSDRIAEGTIPGCPAGAPDPFGTVFVDAACFESNYYSRFEEYWDHFPVLVDFYKSLSPQARDSLQGQMASAGRRYGDTSEPVGEFDIQGFAGLNHYVESLMFRFDRDRNGSLNLDEAMVAYPLFKKLLVEMGNLDPKQGFVIEAAFTYIIKYQKIPKLNAHFIWWIVRKPFWKLNANRAAMFNLISQLSKPEPLPYPES